MTPTARSLAECRRRGWLAEVVERYNSFTKRRKDLFGCIDIVAIIPNDTGCPLGIPRIVGIQATSGTNHASRLTKATREPNIKVWRESGGLFQVWSWSKRGARGRRKLWTLRETTL